MSNVQNSESSTEPTSLDPKVSELAARLQALEGNTSDSLKDSGGGKDDDHEKQDMLSDSELFEELEKDEAFDFAGFRERRMEALKSEMSKMRDMRERDYGKFTEITDEKEVIRTSAKEPRCVIHFFHRDFRRCQIMDKHLELIAANHFKTRFVRVFVENIPWLVEKLQIKILPCVICFVEGVTKDRLIGFEELGNDDAFTTTALELRLAQSGVIDVRQNKTQLVSMYSGPSVRGRDESDEENYRSDD